MKKIYFSFVLFSFFNLTVNAQEKEIELNTSEIINKKPSYNLEEIKQLLYVPKDHKCDTSEILEYKKTFAKCFYNGIETLNISHLGREYIEGEGPKLLFTSENFYLENGEIKYIHEKEYYYYTEQTTREKSVRSWEVYYAVNNGTVDVVKEIEKGKKQRPNFDKQDILKFYQKANDELLKKEKTTNQK